MITAEALTSTNGPQLVRRGAVPEEVKGHAIVKPTMHVYKDIFLCRDGRDMLLVLRLHEHLSLHHSTIGHVNQTFPVPLLWLFPEVYQCLSPLQPLHFAFFALVPDLYAGAVEALQS